MAVDEELQNKSEKWLTSPIRLFIITAVSIFIVETFVMFLLSVLPPLSPVVEMFVDSLILVILVSPLLQLFIFRPLVNHMNRWKKLEGINRVKSNELETIVQHLDGYAESLKLDVKSAKSILNFLNGNIPKTITTDNGNVLNPYCVSIPCAEEGGDHLFIKTIKGNNGKTKTVLSLKDQSGHAVPCLLRSITTDIIHRSLLEHGDKDFEVLLEEMNSGILESNIFEEGEYFTSIGGEIYHDSLIFRYCCNGHPPFFLVRGSEVSQFPKKDEPGHNMPMVLFEDVKFTTGRLQLERGDKIILYTDGIYEMVINEDGTFGVDELQKLVEKYADLPVKEIVDNVLRDVSKLCGKTVDPTMEMNDSDDDVTVLSLEIAK